MRWRQAFAGPAADPGGTPPPAEYFRSPSALVLVDPEGKIAAKSLSGRAALDAVDRALAGLKVGGSRGATPGVRVRTEHHDGTGGATHSPGAAPQANRAGPKVRRKSKPVAPEEAPSGDGEVDGGTAQVTLFEPGREAQDQGG